MFQTQTADLTQKLETCQSLWEVICKNYQRPTSKITILTHLTLLTLTQSMDLHKDIWINPITVDIILLTTTQWHTEHLIILIHTPPQSEDLWLWTHLQEHLHLTTPSMIQVTWDQDSCVTCHTRDNHISQLSDIIPHTLATTTGENTCKDKTWSSGYSQKILY